MAKIGVFDLCSFFWTVAGTRKRGEDPYGLALQVLRYVKACAEKVGVEDVIFGADGPSGRSFRRSVCADYKAGREAKDPEQRAELEALEAALIAAGFTVHKAEASSGSSATGGEAEWFEGDDVAAAFTVKIIKDPSIEVFLASNDWDLAPLLVFPKVRLFTTKGEERTATDVKREFGVEPIMISQLKALAGDSDGYKPFPGLEKGKPGIGEKTAAAILEKFGSAEAAVRAALSDLNASAFDGLPSRTAALLRAGGEAALSMGLTCAKLRTDATVPSDISFGEWEDVERALLERQKAQQSEPRPEVVVDVGRSIPEACKAMQEAAHAQLTGTVARVEVSGRIGGFTGEGAVPDLIGRPRDPEGVGMAEVAPDPICPRCLGVEPGKPGGDPEHPHPGPFTAEFCAACSVSTERPIPVTPLSVGRPIEALAEPYAEGDGPPFMAGSDMRDAGGIAAIEQQRSAPRKRRSKAAATPQLPDLDTMPGDLETANVAPLKSLPDLVFVLLTAVEFVALSPLPALAAAGMLTPPAEYAGRFSAVLEAFRTGVFRHCDGVFIGSVSEDCARGVSELCEAVVDDAGDDQWRTFIDQLRVLPRLSDLAKYGSKLVRA